MLSTDVVLGTTAGHGLWLLTGCSSFTLGPSICRRQTLPGRPSARWQTSSWRRSGRSRRRLARRPPPSESCCSVQSAIKLYTRQVRLPTALALAPRGSLAAWLRSMATLQIAQCSSALPGVSAIGDKRVRMSQGAELVKYGSLCVRWGGHVRVRCAAAEWLTARCTWVGEAGRVMRSARCVPTCSSHAPPGQTMQLRMLRSMLLCCAIQLHAKCIMMRWAGPGHVQ